jgi:hypothetical protein
LVGGGGGGSAGTTGCSGNDKGAGGGGAGGTSETIGVLGGTTLPGVRSGDGEIIVCDAPCVSTVTPFNQTIGSSGGAGNIATVATTSALACGWTAVSNAPWITVTGGSPGTGNGTVTYSVGANPGPNPRRGTVTIGDRTFIVTQATPVLAPCTITIPTGVTIGANEVDLSLAVTASTGSCAWMAQSQVSITITSGASGNRGPVIQWRHQSSPG